MLRGRHILIGISGGIAAYKIPELIRLFKKAGAEVKVTTTVNALEFVTELTLRTLSGNSVYSDVFAAVNQHSTEHISLPDWADAMVIAPATANVLGKMANGIADDALTTTFAAMRKPVVIAPAMNDKMYINPATERAMYALSQQENVLLLDCQEGELACGSTGKGRMQEPESILLSTEYLLTEKDLHGKRILLTAGPTQERLDPVRFISNYSTGKMGFSLARSAWMHGADVTLIAGPTTIQSPSTPSAISPLPQIKTISIRSAQEMYEAAKEQFDKADTAILCAAVADFTPGTTAEQKIKKEPGQTTLELTLRTTPDIAASLGKLKRDGQTLVGFALETHNEEQNAMSKMERKNLDIIVLNSLQDAGAGFGYDTNKVTLLTRDGGKKSYPLLSKDEVAEVIIAAITGEKQNGKSDLI